jgi:propanediol utilization protein
VYSHLSPEHLEILFGKGYELTFLAGLAGFDEFVARKAGFASKETVTIVGPRMGRQLTNVRVLGPCRGATQLELAYTDALAVGIKAPVRISGDTKGSAPFLVIGPKGAIEIEEGAIRAWRHVHMQLTHADWLKVKDGDKMAVRVVSPMCTMLMEDVMVRTVDLGTDLYDYLEGNGIELGMEMHLDTDEGNAVMLKDATKYELLRKEKDGTWTKVFETSKSSQVFEDTSQIVTAPVPVH